MQYGGNSAAPIFYRAVAYHGILSYICRMNEKLLFRRARPADTERIMEIIRQAQAQMRALGSLQWQDGYPATADIGHDIACGYGWVFEKPEAGKSTDARGTDGTGAAGFRAVTAAAGKTTGTEAAGKTGVSGADETAAAAEEAEKAGEAGGRGETEPAKAAAAQGNVIAYGAVVFDGEPAYDAIEGAWLTDGEYVVLHRMAVADGEKGRGVATEFMRRVEAMAHGRGTGASTPISTTVTCCACSDGWGSSIAARYATGAANGWHSRNPSGHEGIKRGNRPYGRFPLQDECVTIPCNNSPGEIS